MLGVPAKMLVPQAVPRSYSIGSVHAGKNEKKFKFKLK